MSFDWRDLQIIAKTLYSPTGNEAALRSAINRSYYAAFQTSVAFATATRGFQKDRLRGDHERIIMEMKGYKNQSLKEVGRKLARLKDFRREADYEDNVPNIEPTAKASIILGDKIIEIINSNPS